MDCAPGGEKGAEEEEEQFSEAGDRGQGGIRKEGVVEGRLGSDELGEKERDWCHDPNPEREVLHRALLHRACSGAATAALTCATMAEDRSRPTKTLSRLLIFRRRPSTCSSLSSSPPIPSFSRCPPAPHPSMASPTSRPPPPTPPSPPPHPLPP